MEALACFGLTGFLAFYGARVAGHEAGAAESSLVVGVNFNQSASDAEAKCFGLAFEAATVEVDLDVVFFNDVESGEGLLHDELKNRRGEVHFQGTVVDGDGAVTFFEDYASHGGFTTAYCIYCFHTFDYFSLLMSIALGA